MMMDRELMETQYHETLFHERWPCASLGLEQMLLLQLACLLYSLFYKSEMTKIDANKYVRTLLHVVVAVVVAVVM